MKIGTGDNSPDVGSEGLTTVGGTAKHRRPTVACTLDANELGHLSEVDDTAGSQPDLMQ